MSPAERGAAGGPCGGGERRPVRALRRLSERGAAEEPRALEEPRGTWAEAVHGWGRTGPLACSQLQKQARKAKASDAATSCLICSDMLQPLERGVGQDVKTKRNPSKYDSKFSVDAASESALEKEEIPTRPGKFNCYPTANGIKTETRHSTLHPIQPPQGEKMTLPVKEHCMWNLEAVKHPEGERQKEVKPHGLDMPNADGSSKASLLFPPVKDATPNDTSDPSWKSKMTVISQKWLTGASLEMAPYNQDAEAADPKGIKGADQVKEKTEIPEQSSFVPGHGKVSLLQEDPEQSLWPCAPVANKTTATISNPIALKRNSHHSCKQLPHSVGIQHTKNYDAQGSLTNNVRNRYVENKQEKEAKNQAVPPLSGLLPSLTISRAARTTLPSRLT